MTELPPDFRFEISMLRTASMDMPNLQREEKRLKDGLDALIQKGYTIHHYFDYNDMTTKYHAFLPKKQLPPSS